ncbi:MAG: DNA replication and repair protein RecF [Bacteroidota bacterium]
MFFTSLQLTHFRNYPHLQADFCAGINCITGPNGSGKTNVLEALHYLAFTRGIRSHQDKQALKDGEDFFLLEGNLQEGEEKALVQCNFLKSKGKKLFINRVPAAKMSDHIGRIPLVAIMPDDTELINGPSAGRRRFMDMLISQYSPAYLHHLIQYDKLLLRRNAQLKLFAEQRYFDREQLQLWNEQMLPHGRAISEERNTFLEAFFPIFETYFHQIVSEKEQPSIRYRSQLEVNTEAGWQEVYATWEARDLANCYTGVGTHRDDLVFQIDGTSVRNYGSQGQQKTFVIALKLAQYQLLEQHKQLAPILLLDDLFDKLDEFRLGEIAGILTDRVKGQVFITDTSRQNLEKVFSSLTDRAVNYYRVLQGDFQPGT